MPIFPALPKYAAGPGNCARDAGLLNRRSPLLSRTILSKAAYFRNSQQIPRGRREFFFPDQP